MHPPTAKRRRTEEVDANENLPGVKPSDDSNVGFNFGVFSCVF